MTEQLTDVKALDLLCKAEGMSRPQGFGAFAEGGLSIVHEYPNYSYVVRAMRMEETSLISPSESGDQTPPSQVAKVLDWIKLVGRP